MNLIKTVYCDFDGTITKKDSVNTFFEMYAHEKWLEYEDLWMKGLISSRENAIKQVALIRKLTQQEFDKYIEDIEINDYFLEFYQFLKQKNVKLVIVSDGFDIFVKEILKRLNINDVEYYANRLIFENGLFKIEFPNYTSECIKGSGTCKCSKVKEKDFCYIGDGNSDLCVAKKAKYLFASKYLEKYCSKENIKHYSFENFGDIIRTMKEEHLV